jgi:hypothetical protein
MERLHLSQGGQLGVESEMTIKLQALQPYFWLLFLQPLGMAYYCPITTFIKLLSQLGLHLVIGISLLTTFYLFFYWNIGRIYWLYSFLCKK